jgi:hypothetical protein
VKVFPNRKTYCKALETIKGILLYRINLTLSYSREKDIGLTASKLVELMLMLIADKLRAILVTARKLLRIIITYVKIGPNWGGCGAGFVAR